MCQGTEAIWKGVRPCGERLYLLLHSKASALAKLKSVFERRKDSRRKYDGFEFAGRFHLTSCWPSILFAELANAASDMKKISILSVVVSFAMICSCQKQDSAAEQELAQRKTELDARENALDERMSALDERVKALDERVKVLAENQNALANASTSSTGVQGDPPDPAQEQAERERIQQFSAEMRAKMADPSRLNSARVEKERRNQDRLAERQRALDGSQTQKQRKTKMFSGAVFPAPAAPSSTVETTAPTPSPTP